MVAGKSAITNTIYLVYLQYFNHYIFYVYRTAGGSWSEPARLSLPPSLMHPTYLETNNLACAHYSDNKLAFFNIMDYFESGGNDIYIHSTYEKTPSDPVYGWTPWFGLYEDHSPDY